MHHQILLDDDYALAKMIDDADKELHVFFEGKFIDDKPAVATDASKAQDEEPAL